MSANEEIIRAGITDSRQAVLGIVISLLAVSSSSVALLLPVSGWLAAVVPTLSAVFLGVLIVNQVRWERRINGR